MDSSSSASYHSFGSSDDHLLKQVEVMIANEEIYTPKSEIFISPCMIERENTVSKTSLETATVITSPPRSPTSVVLDDTTDTSSRETYPPTKKFKSRRAGGSGRLTSDIHREVCQWMYKVRMCIYICFVHVIYVCVWWFMYMLCLCICYVHIFVYMQCISLCIQYVCVMCNDAGFYMFY